MLAYELKQDISIVMRWPEAKVCAWLEFLILKGEREKEAIEEQE